MLAIRVLVIHSQWEKSPKKQSVEVYF